MFFKIQIDWNKYIVLPVDKDTAPSMLKIFGEADSVWQSIYERSVGGEGLIPSKDWKPTVTVIRADEFVSLKEIGARYVEFRNGETTQEAA
jgi:hypothetical protein